MKNWTFRQWNTVLGWVIFVIAFITYLSTIEHYLSFWDCGEYISSAVKLEVTHAPGAALFQIVGAVAAIFALGKGENYSIVINAMSATFSAFTILFLFWTITHFVRRLLNKDFEEVTKHQEISILFAGVVGALCFTFSDTFWFSAVEGEVYSMASMFIALLVWLITKWENEYNTSDNERWIILIFFIVGLSVGVHMMCMLSLPAICLVYYARNYKFTWKNFIWANLITLGILIIVFKIIFPLIMTMFGKLEIFFVNGLGLPFHSGTIAAFILMVAICYFMIKYARKSKKSIYQTVALSIVYMVIGFSCWMVIPIRANANPPMNLNDPDTAIGMLDYYNRAQYGDWPTIYGQNYTAFLDANGIEKNEDGSFKTKKTGDIYEKDEKTGTYRKTGERFNYVFSKSQVSLMPRMFNEDKDVMANYISMYGAPDFTFNYGNEDVADNPQAKEIFNELRKKYEDKTITAADYLKVKPYDLINVQKPSLAQNMDYFITFQNGYYFVRYLMWNFVGRQNDREGHMESTNGNWISGFSFIDNAMWGNQDKMPAKFKNESTVAFFFLPLILGLIGFFFQLNRDFGRFYALLSLFILTGAGIVFYTGVKPFEVRERDYAMVGSFYAFAIWIGLGAGAILWFLQSKVKSGAANIVAGVVLLGIPFMMGFQNYNTHDRSRKSAAHDYAYSFLKSLPKEDIIFLYGDNDTFPVWAIQETENFRDDVKTVNFTLLATPWYCDQVKRKTYNANPIPGELTRDDYKDGVNDQVYIMKKEDWQNIFENLKEHGAPETEFQAFRKYLTQDSMTLKEAINFIKMKSPEKDEILKMIFGEAHYEKYNFLPVNKFILPVNKENALKAGIINPSDLPNTVNQIMIDYKANTLFKGNLMMFDIFANFDWKRPINFSSGGIYDSENIFYLDDYLQFDGFSYRLVPIHTPPSGDGDMGRVDANSLYNVVKNFKWGNFKDLTNHYDETATSNIIYYRSTVSRAVGALSSAGQKDKAIELLDLAAKEIPTEKYNDPRSLSSIVYGYIVAGQEQKGLKLAEVLKKGIFEEYDYYLSLSPGDQRYLRRQMGSKPMEYSLVVSAVTSAYKAIGLKDKAYDYLVKSIEPIDKKFNVFIKGLQQMGKEKAMNESENVQRITPFYQYLFDIMKPFDSTYSKEKEQQITTAIMKATQ
ncbi:glycosyltransferase family 117 protein [Chryseobacterium proteolyticum]|uniref:glycosyltransferase family 117 protein n=1 Tax=Chryseobacterium proteolyticum TaxID=118127 RepID=UPI003983B782